MKVSEAFTKFCSNITVNNVSDISARYKQITKRLNQDFYSSDSDTAHSFYTGSYGRETAIRGISDLDMIFEIPYETYQQADSSVGNGQSALLQKVRTSILKTYPNTDVGGDGQVVVVSFTDGMQFEVVPAIKSTTDKYIYPDANSGGSWKTTDPKPEIAACKKANDDMNGNFYRLCRMTRAWKAARNVTIGGLLIDTLANNFLSSYEYKKNSYLYYDWMCRDFLKYLSERDSKQDYWLAIGSNQYVYRKGGYFEYKALVCYNIAKEAIDYYAANGYDYTAHEKWREIFGSSFPLSSDV